MKDLGRDEVGWGEEYELRFDVYFEWVGAKEVWGDAENDGDV